MPDELPLTDESDDENEAEEEAQQSLTLQDEDGDDKPDEPAA